VAEKREEKEEKKGSSLSAVFPLFARRERVNRKGGKENVGGEGGGGGKPFANAALDGRVRNGGQEEKGRQVTQREEKGKKGKGIALRAGGFCPNCLCGGEGKESKVRPFVG